MRVLVTGQTGQVGSEIVRALRDRVDLYAPRRTELDLADSDEIRRYVRSLQPDLVINAAAYTAVDRAESEPDEAIAINTRAPAIMAELARLAGFSIVHYSTDYVFDGSATEPYTEDDVATPLGVYGRTKRLGDRAIEHSGTPHMILRVSWVYSGHTGNFLTTMLGLVSERPEVNVVADEIGTPTSARDIARTTVRALEAVGGPVETWSRETLRAGLAKRGGLYHVSPRGETSWHGFALEIRRSAVKKGIMNEDAASIHPITAAEWPSAARRPANSRLSAARLARELGLALPDWREGVSECLDTLACPAPRG